MDRNLTYGIACAEIRAGLVTVKFGYSDPLALYCEKPFFYLPGLNYQWPGACD